MYVFDRESCTTFASFNMNLPEEPAVVQRRHATPASFEQLKHGPQPGSLAGSVCSENGNVNLRASNAEPDYELVVGEQLPLVHALSICTALQPSRE